MSKKQLSQFNISNKDKEKIFIFNEGMQIKNILNLKRNNSNLGFNLQEEIISEANQLTTIINNKIKNNEYSTVENNKTIESGKLVVLKIFLMILSSSNN